MIYGGVASGTMIYGMSWIFGITGSLDFSVINKVLSTPEHLPVLAVFIALVLILTGMGYKVSSVPFHMWAPDVIRARRTRLRRSWRSDRRLQVLRC